MHFHQNSQSCNKLGYLFVKTPQMVHFALDFFAETGGNFLRQNHILNLEHKIMYWNKSTRKTSMILKLHTLRYFTTRAGPNFVHEVFQDILENPAHNLQQ
jgi:hypothetical protein